MLGRSKLTAEQLLALLEAAISEAPPLKFETELTQSDLRWLARAEAVVEASGSMPDLIDFRVARKSLGTYTHSRDGLLAPLHNAYCKVELHAPEAARGAFIPAGDTWNGYAALVKLIQRECDDLLIVDPYVNASLFTDFAPHALTRSGLRCITTKRPENDPGLLAAARKWAADPLSAKQSVAVRYAPAGSLHDRMIIIDNAEAWLVSQSLKDIAKRSPASVSRAETELAALKAAHYNSLWEASSPIPA